MYIGRREADADGQLTTNLVGRYQLYALKNSLVAKSTGSTHLQPNIRSGIEAINAAHKTNIDCEDLYSRRNVDSAGPYW